MIPARRADGQFEKARTGNVGNELTRRAAGQDVLRGADPPTVREDDEVGVGAAARYIVVQGHTAAEAGESAAEIEGHASGWMGAQRVLVGTLRDHDARVVVTEIAAHAERAIADF